MAAVIVNNLAFLCLSVATAVAVLKYRLSEIDRIISRTLAYTIATGLLVGLLQGWSCWPPGCCRFLLRGGGRLDAARAAALFSPLRSGVQRAVDRRFNRARYQLKSVSAI